MIHNIKNYILSIAALSMLLCSTGCNSEPTQTTVPTSDDLLSSFVLTYNGSQYHAAIDQEGGSMSISAIEYSSLITEAKYTLGAGATISPIPGEQPWATSQSYTVSRGSESKIYTLALPNITDEEVTNPDPDTKGYKVVGYLPVANGAYESRINQIDWGNLSHVIVSFLQVKADGTLAHSAPTLSSRLDEIKEVAANNNFKVMIAVQSSNTKEANFYNAIKNSSTRSALIERLVNFVDENELDGIDIDFEEYDYVGDAAYTSFIFELGEALDLLEAERGSKVLYSVAVAPNYNTYPTSLGKMVDFINLMIYDLKAYSAVNVDHASVADFKSLMEASITKFGATKEQLIGGVPFYGYTYDNLGKNDNATTASATQKSYSDIFAAYLNKYGADYLAKNGKVENTIYDGQNKIAQKCQHVVDNSYGGIMIWQIVQDLADTHEEYKLLPVIGRTLESIEGK